MMNMSVMYSRPSNVFATEAMPPNPRKQNMTVFHFPVFSDQVENL